MNLTRTISLSLLMQGLLSSGHAQNLAIRSWEKDRIPAAIQDYPGSLQAFRAWEDQNGENWLIFSQTYQEEPGGYQTSYLYAYHYVCEGKNCRLIRKAQDFVKECDFDLFLDLIPESIYVSDWDDDGYGEVSWMYRLGCYSDASPQDLKLLMFENGEKYAIRGNTILGDIGGGDKRVDPSFSDAPALQRFAERHWNWYVRQY